jgi:cytoskeleton protein RodZ
MPDVGHLLQDAREQKRLTLEDVERELKIRQKFLVALENDQRNHVLDPIYMRGFLKNYARFLGLDPAEVMRLYDGGVQPPSVLPPLAPPVRPALKPPVMGVLCVTPPVAAPEPPAAAEPGQTPPRRTTPLRFVPVGAIALVLMLGVMGGAFQLVGGVGAVGGALRLVAGVGAMPPANATALWAKTAVLQPGKVSAAPQSTPTPKPSPTITLTPSVTPTPTITPTPTPIVYTGVDIELVVSDRAWLQVTADGQKAFEGILEAGQRRSWHGNDKVQVRCGNGGGVEALVNGLSIGKLGELGQVVDNEWLKESVPAVAPAAPVTATPAAGSAISSTTTLTGTAPVVSSATATVNSLPTNTPTAASPTQTATPTGPVSINVVPVGSSKPVTITAPVSPTTKQ